MKPKGLAKTLLGTSALTAAIVVSFLAPTASAVSDTWSGTTDATWATSTNWLGGNVPGTGDTATFNDAGNGNTTIDLGGGVTIGTVLFDTASAAAYTVGSGAVGSQTLTLDNAGTITINSGVTTNQLFNSNVQLSNAANATATITNNGSGTLTIAGTLSANAASGNGVLNVAGSGNTTITGAVTEVGAGNSALKKTGSGTLTLSNGSTFNGTGASQPRGAGTGGNSALTGPVIVQEGTLLLNGGTHTVTGEVVIGGIAANHGDAGQNAKIQVDAGAFNISSWLSVGRGNGTGTATSDLEINNAATVTAGNLSAGYNGGSALNTPKGTITLNGTSSLSITNNNYIAESAGSNFTVNVNGTAQYKQTIASGTANQNETRVGVADNAVGTINVNGGTASFERDAIFGYAGTSTGRLNLTSGTVNVASTAERWLMLGRDGASKGEITIDGGNLNLNTNSDIRFGRNAGASGTSFVTLNGGNISGFTGNNNGIFSVNSVVDLNFASTQAGVNNTFNLNGGTLTIGQVMTTNNTGTAAFNFNGGTLRAAGTTAAFLDLGGANQRVNVRNGGAIIDTNGFNVTAAQALLHSNIGGDNAIDGGLAKNGLGTLTLSGASTYTGATLINVGTLALASTGSLASTQITTASGATFDVSAVSGYSVGSGVTLTNNGTVNGGFTVASGGTVNGSGTFSGAVTVNGNLNPGNSPGSQTYAGGLTLGAASTTTMEIAGSGGVAGTDFDFIDVTGGTLTNDGSLAIVDFGAYDISAQTGTYNLFDFVTGAGDFDVVTVDGNSLTFNGGTDEWNSTVGDVTYNFAEGTGVLSVTVVPEPTAALLGGIGLLGLLRRRRVA
jgi:autotransporter-associated beta strand protein